MIVLKQFSYRFYLSIADILAVLYGQVLKVKPNNPAWKDRDRFILSKGHAGAGVYVLAEKGFRRTYG